MKTLREALFSKSRLEKGNLKYLIGKESWWLLDKTIYEDDEDNIIFTLEDDPLSTFLVSKDRVALEKLVKELKKYGFDIFTTEKFMTSMSTKVRYNMIWRAQEYFIILFNYRNGKYDIQYAVYRDGFSDSSYYFNTKNITNIGYATDLSNIELLLNEIKDLTK